MTVRLDHITPKLFSKVYFASLEGLRARRVKNISYNQFLPGDKSKWVPPDPIPNSEVKPFSANDSVGLSMPKSVIARRLFEKPEVG